MATEPVVIRPSDLATDAWDDPTRGRVEFATVFSGDQTPTDSMVSGFAEVPAGRDFHVHRHEPAEIYHVLAGEGVVHLDGREFPVEAGSVVFIPGGSRHGIHTTSDEPLRLFYVLAADSFADVTYDFAAESAA